MKRRLVSGIISTPAGCKHGTPLSKVRGADSALPSWHLYIWKHLCLKHLGQRSQEKQEPTKLVQSVCSSLQLVWSPNLKWLQWKCGNCRLKYPGMKHPGQIYFNPVCVAYTLSLNPSKWKFYLYPHKKVLNSWTFFNLSLILSANKIIFHFDLICTTHAPSLKTNDRKIGIKCFILWELLLLVILF